MELQTLIREIGRGAKGARSLDVERARALFAAMLDGELGELELGAIVMALRIKSESTEELLGFMAALDARTPQLPRIAGLPATVVLPSVNGMRRAPNLMPLLALTLRQRGVPVLIHGRQDFANRHNSFALLRALGVREAGDIAEAGRVLAGEGLAFLETAAWVPGLDRLMALRLRLGVRGTAHTLVKLLDPCKGHSVRVVAVTHPEYLARLTDFLCRQGGRAMLMRATEGEPFAHPLRCPRMLAFADGAVREVCPAQEGAAEVSESGPEGAEALIRATLAGERPLPSPLAIQIDALEALARAV